MGDIEMTSTIDPAKTYRTRDGREVRIYAVDGGGNWPVHGAIRAVEGSSLRPCVFWASNKWNEGGMAHANPSDYDLIEVKPKHVRWVNVYVGCAAIYDSHQMAESWAQDGRLACVRIEFEEGEGL